VGVLAVEFFVCRGRLIANEMAPRVHNSGHWTIEGAVTSQFENHLRAILNLPLGRTDPLGHSAMINLIGEMPERDRLLRAPGVHLHDYGKTARPGRKLGHCTIVATTARRRDAAARKLLKELALPIRIP
jgi:5-(carboxyamino)imidazole ribonucleotide synthase